MIKFYLTLSFVLISIVAQSQSQDDFNTMMSEVYALPMNSEESVEKAKSLYDLVKESKDLQTMSNYFILSNIFETFATDEQLAADCKELANAMMPSYAGTSDTGGDWLTIHLTEMFQSLQSARKAAHYLDNHTELQTFSNLTMLASALSYSNDLKKAGLYFDQAMQLETDSQYEYYSYSGYANYLCKTGEYGKVDNVLLKMKQQVEKASETFKPGYTFEYLNVISSYSLLLGDYHSYIQNQKNLFDNYPENTQDNCNTAESSYYTIIASAYELVGDYGEALKNFIIADSSAKATNRCLIESNPGTYFSDYVYPSYDIYLARIGKQDQFTKPQSQLINETKAYYASLNIDQPLMKLGEASIIGFLGGDSYHEPYQNYLKAMVKTQDYSVSSSPFAAYAFFCTRDGLYDQSLETYKELFKLNEKWINDLIFTFGEKAFITYFNSKLKDGYNDYHSLVRLLVEAKDERSAAALAQAYDNILLTKSIAFKSSQKRKKAFMKQNSPEIVALYQTWLDKKQQLLRAYQMKQEAEPKVQVMDVEELQNEVHQIENELATNSKNYKELLTIDHPKWQEVRNNLKEGEAAVELIRFNWRDQLFYSDSAYYAAYVITKESKYPEVIYLPTMAKDLDGKFYNYYTNSVKLKSDNSSAFQAYWAPIQSQLQGVKKVYFSADGIYHLINLPTLKNPTTDQYLLDEIDIQYITSTSDIGSSHQSSASKNAVLMGRPAYETGEADKENEILKPEETRSFIRNFRNNSVSDLPGTEEEVLAIEQVMQPQGMTVTTYIGASATEEVLYALEQPDILHIATHGYWSASEDGASPGFRMFNAMINSGLLLAGVVDFYQSDLIPNTHDGILTAYEAQNLDLENTDLVVLSACETGLGHFDAGEGVYGLQRAFRSAGAKSVINSLWKVDDEATKDFMIAFYSHYLAGESKFDAFSNTQKEMKSKYVDPYFWGAFVLVGE